MTDSWKHWNGGKRPVHINTLVEVILRSDLMQSIKKQGKSPETRRMHAGSINWENHGIPQDVVAYRVIDSSNLPELDWKYMPVDTLVEGPDGRIYYFSGIAREGIFVFPDGRSSKTATSTDKEVRILKPKLATGQSWNTWTGGMCPVDNNVRVEYHSFKDESSWNYHAAYADEIRWVWTNSPDDIISWRISDEQDLAE